MKTEITRIKYECDYCGAEIHGNPRHIRFPYVVGNDKHMDLDFCVDCFEKVMEAFRMLADKLKLFVTHEVVEHGK